MANFSQCDEHDECFKGLQVKLDKLLDNSQEFEKSIIEYIAGLKIWQDTATEYRKSICQKIDSINEKIVGLPCRERQERFRGQKIFDGLLWGAIGITFGILIIHLGWR